MKYDFTTHINRRPMNSKKWFYMDQWNDNLGEDVVPLATADMEFQNAPEIIDGLKDYLDDIILGYTKPSDSYFKAVMDWMDQRHDWKVNKEWIVLIPGVVTAISLAIETFSEPGDGVIIFRPVYQQFGYAIDGKERTEVNVPLIEGDNGHYDIDFEAFEEAAAKSENKILIFCNPHNPVGRVWTQEELEKVAQIASDNNLTVISDEIWHDFVFEGHQHIPFAEVSQEAEDITITCTAVSKSFNLAGINQSNIIIANPKLRQAFKKRVEAGHYEGTALSYRAVELAYTQGEAWLDECLQVIYDNHKFITSYFEENFPKIKGYVPEGTYVSWLDFRDLGLSPAELRELTYQDAEFMANQGTLFGKEEGAGFERANLALPQKDLEVQLDRLVKVLKEKGY